MHNLDAVLFLEAFDHRSGGCRAADDRGAQRTQIVTLFIEQGEQAEPDRRDAGREGDFLGLDQFGQIARLQMRAGKDDLGADHGAGKRRAPGHDVEHRHHGQEHVAFAQAQRIGHRQAQAVQHDRSVRVDHAFGIARRARGVAHARRVVLVEMRPGIIGAGGAQQFFVSVDRFEFAIGRDFVVHHHVVLDALQMRREFFHGGQQRRIDEHHLIVGVIDDVGELIAGQAQVQRMQHRAHARHGEVQLQVARIVPRKRRHAIAAPHAEFFQRIGQPRHALGHLGVGVTRERRPGFGDDLFFAVQLACSIEDVRQRQRIIHHLSAHGRTPWQLGMPLL